MKVRYTIKELRARKNISQEDLAKSTGLSARTIYNYEKDVNNLRNASYSTIKRVAEVLGVGIDEIFLG